MAKITDDFVGGETVAVTKQRLSDILDYWYGSNSLSGVSTWGNVRTLLNSVAGGAITILDGELAGSFRPKINTLNDPDAVVADTLFSANEPSVWYDPSDLSTLFQDAAGTVPVTAAGQPVGRMLDKSGNNNHATQATTAARPTYQTDGVLHWLSFDGVDDYLVTPVITPSIDKVQVFAGVRKLRDYISQNTGESILEFSVDPSLNPGSFILSASTGFNTNRKFGIQNRGSITALTQTHTTSASFAAPTTNALTCLCDIVGDTVTLHIDGIQEAQTTADQGSGNYLAYPMYIGCRGGNNLFFSGHIYGLITRFGANLPIATVAGVERYISAKTGVTI